MVKALPAIGETQVRFLDSEDPLEKEMATDSISSAWKILRMEDGWRNLVGYSPWGRQESDTTERLHFLSFLIGIITKSCPTLLTPWTIACQASLSMGFSRQDSVEGHQPPPGLEESAILAYSHNDLF